MDRVTAFFNSGQDEAGNNFQTTQSIMAIGNGGLHGLGLGASRAKFFYIPESHTDGVFAIISEELGMIAALALIVLFVAFMIRGYTVANRSHDGFGALLATGITTWVIAQAMLNIGGITRVIPLTGVPLPFLSYGGSALMAVMAGVGVLISVSRFSSASPPPNGGDDGRAGPGERRIVHRGRAK
jgi:cell division protein FtsW